MINVLDLCEIVSVMSEFESFLYYTSILDGSKENNYFFELLVESEYGGVSYAPDKGH
jgi:hypothetical protein